MYSASTVVQWVGVHNTDAVFVVGGRPVARVTVTAE